MTKLSRFWIGPAAIFAACLSGVTLADDGTAKPEPPPAEGKGVEELATEELDRLFRGHTFSGYHFGSGRTFSEYHQPDGRVIGHNGVSINTDGCWYVREGAVCYAYGPDKDRRTYCFVMHRSGKSVNMTLTALPERRLIGIGVWEEGNARNHKAPNDWTCEANMSMRPGLRPALVAHRRAADPR